MRVTHATRCTAVLTPGTRPSFWTLGHFWNEAAYNASPNIKKTLMSVALMAALGYNFATSTSNAPGTVIGSDGTVQYGAHNLLAYSADFSQWSLNNSVTLNGAGSPISYNGASIATSQFVSNGTNNGPYKSFSVTPASGLSFTVIAYVRRVSGSGSVKIGSDAGSFAPVTLNPSTGGLSGGNATASGSLAVGSAWLVWVTYTSAGTAPNAVIYGAAASTTFEAALAGVYGSKVLDYVATTSAAVYGPRIPYDRGATSQLLTYPEDFSQAAWVATQNGTGTCTKTPNYSVAPDGTQTACRVVATKGNSSGYLIQTVTGLPNPHTYAVGVWVKSNTGANQTFAVCDGNASAAYATATPSWTFVQNAGAAAATAGGILIGAFGAGSDASIDISIWHPQQNASPVATAYLRTTATAPLYAAGTPKSQNLISNSTVPIAGAGSNTTDAVDGTTGYRKITSPGAGAYNFEPAITTVSGCVYVAQFSLYATGTSSSATIFANGSGGGLLTSTVASGPGAITGGDATNPRITGLSQSVPTVVQVTWLGQKILSIYPTATGGGSSSGGEALLVTAMQANEGSVLLPYVATTGTPYSLYYQRSIVRENAATRETLQPRDLTQAAWGKNTTTVTKDQTGIDGVANSACKVVSGAAGSTVYQGVTSASANRVLSFYARSISATTVTVGIKANAGSTYTDVVVTPQWQRFTVAEASITNPVYAIKFYANGDSIAIDFVQGEQGTFATSPIWGTESAAQTRSADLIRPPASYVSDAGPQSTVIAVIAQSATSGAGQILLGRSGNGFANYLHSSGKGALYDSTNLTLGPTVVPVGVPTRVATRYSGSAAGVCTDGGSISTGTFDGSMGTAGATPGLGDDGGGGTGFAGEILSLEIATTVANDATLQVAALGLAA